jgi:hypothetical protein
MKEGLSGLRFFSEYYILNIKSIKIVRQFLPDISKNNGLSLVEVGFTYGNTK